MQLSNLKKRENISIHLKGNKLYSQLNELINELKEKELSQDTIYTVNLEIEALNTSTVTEKKLLSLIRTTQIKIIRHVEKQHKIVPKNYYQNLWMVLGMSVIGIPLGIIFGLSIGNMSFLAIGLPIGMGVGIAIGATMDRKALKEGRQLHLDIK